MSAGGARALFLFTRDLRLEDHAGLLEAARYGAVVPALVFDSHARERVGRNPGRAAYYCGALASLEAALAARGARLICRRGPLVSTVRRLARDAATQTVVWSAAYDAASRERGRRLQSSLEEAGVRALIVHDAPAVPPEASAAARTAEGGLGYRALAPFMAAWAELPRSRLAGPIRFAALEIASEALPSAEEFGVTALEVPPSEARTLRALDAYLASHVLRYGAARNVPGAEPTSRLAPDLSFGTIAARTVLARADERLRDRFLLAEERFSLRAFVRALAQRDFFLQLAWFFEGARDEAFQARMRGFPFATRHPALEAWREGRTGYPLVDAGIRQLRETGWMHPRVRLVAASFLCFDLGVAWRIGRDEWDRHLVEDEPALATGNWQWVAGVGADLAQFPRIFNPHKQARALDPRGAYMRAWLPELASLPDADVLDPAAATRRAQLVLPLFDGAFYPPPVVDHETAARAFLRRYATYRASLPVTP
ncbi:MAG: FAD-binding domain-containing protein [Vulcanimicrobiaceae bacterium]